MFYLNRVGCAVLVMVLALAAESNVGQSQASDLRIEPLVPEQAQDAFTFASFTYQGRIRLGGTPINGTCDFQFSLWDAAAGGNQVGSTQSVLGVGVADGLFTVLLSAGGEFGANPFPGPGRWLETAVRSPAGSGSYTTLTPRQAITPEPWALGLRPGALITGGQPSILSATTTNAGANASAIHGLAGTASAFGPGGQAGLWGDSNQPSGVGVFGSSQSHYGVMGKTANGNAGVVGQIGNLFGTINANERPGVWGISSDTGGFGVLGDGFNGSGGVRGRANGLTGEGVRAETFNGGVFSVGLHAIAHGGGTGIIGESDATTGSWAGVYGQTLAPSGIGIQGYASHVSGANVGVSGESKSLNGYGGSFINTSNDGIALYASGDGATKNKATLRVVNTEPACGIAAYLTNNSTCATAHLLNQGTGQILWLQNGGDINGANAGDFITCVNFGENDAQCRILSSGEVRSDVGFNTPAADFAEMLPARERLDPGDVLAIGDDGRLERASQAYQGNVVGVHSTRPGFTGGYPMTGEVGDRVPLAVVGIVPVKASAENGSIHVGDLLVSSATPGHCMRGEGVERCFGRTIGKALDKLEAGRGTIRALIFQR